ncbi:EF-hand domain-containing protein [Dokdonella sp.]|uniref:EF-hand domain-containing protein n=1 Tax=Dokdonella sp. TaxID=2291710 RepID=UPI001B17DC98|nr:EF-hand domain-containing protein [Dokdonella sp.]MBO9661348.1 EF-hand domain-containing protein [Dokdonella sp.]
MSTHSVRAALPFAALVLLLGLGAAHAQSRQSSTPSTKAAAAAASADDDEDGNAQKERRARYVARAFDRFDTNHDGQIDREEFAVGLGKYLDRQRNAFNRDFKAADANGDGKLSKEEASDANPVLAEHFEDIDANHDGFLTKSEIRASIREQQTRVTVEGDDQDDDAGTAAKKD